MKEARVVKEARGVRGEALESVTPRSKTRLPDVEGLSEVFWYSREERRASACESERVPPPFLAKVRVLSPGGDGSGDGVGDAAQDDIGDGVSIGEIEIDGDPGGGGVDDEFFAGAVEDFSCGDGELDAVVGIRSFRISDGDSASDIEVRAAFCEGA